MRDFEDEFTGLGCLPGGHHTEVDLGTLDLDHDTNVAKDNNCSKGLMIAIYMC